MIENLPPQNQTAQRRVIASRWPYDWPLWLQYAFSFAAIAAALGLRWLLDPVLQDRVPLVTVFVPLLPLALLVRPGPFVVVGIFGIAGALYFFIPPRFSFEIDNVATALQMGLGVVAAVATAGTVWLAQRSREALRRRNEELEALRSAATSDLEAVTQLHALGVACAGAETIREQCVQQCLETAIAIMNADKGNVQLVDDATGALRIAAQVGFEQPFLDFFASVRTNDPSACAAAMSGVGRTMVEDITRSEIFAGQPSLRVLLEAGVRAVQSTPLVSSTGKVLGMVSTHFRDPHRLPPREARFMDLLARQTADYLERLQGEQDRERYAHLLDAGFDAVVVRDPEDRIISWNRGAMELYGWTRDEALGQVTHALFQTQFPKPLDEILADVLRNNHWEGELVHIRKGGTVITVFSRWTLERDAHGHRISILETNMDITERKRVEQQRADDAARIGSVVNHVVDGIITIDEHGAIESFNPAAEKLFGYTGGEVIGQNVRLLMPEPFHSEHDGYLTSYLRTGQAKVIGIGREVAGRRKDGSTFPMELAVSEFRLGGHRYFTGIVRDITERKRVDAERAELLRIAERARAEAEKAAETMARVQRITEIMLGDLPLDKLMDQVLLRVHEELHADVAVILVRGLEEEEILHLRAAVGVNVDEEEVHIRVGEYFAGRVAKERRPLVWNQPDPELIWPLLRRRDVRALAGVPLLSDDHLLGVLHVASVTPREFTDEEVNLLSLAGERVALGIERAARRDAERRARETAERSNRVKDEFLAMLGHELRNPLSAVRNAITIASLDESHRPRALDIARRQADQLSRLIDDLLDVTRITQGRITLRKERVHLTEIVERALESTRSFIEERGLRLNVALTPDPIRVEADPARLEQMFVNLLTNAGKYTDAGGRISLIAERRGKEAVVRIRDTGIGIAPEVLPHVWDLFTQADRALDRAQGGLGIGLTVARRLVELHSGRIEAHSEGVGKGAEFVVILPALPAITEEARPPASTQPLKERHTRILMVEDNPDAAESLTMLLELLGHRVRAVHDGQAALEAAHANIPDVMLVDIGLPGMDGFEVARRIRRDPDLKHVVLVALTGYGREEDKREAMDAGFDYHLVKPASPDGLQEVLAWVVQDNPRKPLPAH